MLSYYILTVKYLGYKIFTEGIQFTKENVPDIKEPPPTTNVTQLFIQDQAFLKLVCYYGKFLPHLASVWQCFTEEKALALNGEQHKRQPSRKQKLLTFDGLLVYFDITKELLLLCDGSPYEL